MAEISLLSPLLEKCSVSKPMAKPPTQNTNWNWQRPMGMANLPIGARTQNQPMLPAPYPVQHNQQPAIRPQLPTQPNPNPNNRSVQLIQIIENSNSSIEQKHHNELKLRSGRTILPIEATNPPQSRIETSTEPSLTNIT